MPILTDKHPTAFADHSTIPAKAEIVSRPMPMPMPSIIFADNIRLRHDDLALTT
jgi:hypothetical protein